MSQRNALPRGLAALAVLLALGAAPAARAAATYHVDGSSAACSDAGPGSEAQPYCTISAAVAARKGAGVTILVRPGVYREQVTVPASGAAGDSFVIRAQGAAVLDGADDLAAAGLWQDAGGAWLASSVTWAPQQVFVDGARLAASTAAPAAMPPMSFRYVAGTGLYVNAGGGNPGLRATLVSRRAYGFRLDRRSWVSIEGFTVTRQNDRGIYLTGPLASTRLEGNRTTASFRNGIAAVGCSLLAIARNVVADHADHGIYLQNVSRSVIADNESYGNSRPVTLSANGIYLTGCSLNRIERNRLHHNSDTGLHFQSSADNLCVQNASWANGDHGFDHLATTGTRHVGGVAFGNARSGFMVQSGSTGTGIANVIAARNGLATGHVALSVDASSTAGIASDHNLYWNPGQPAVRFGAATYGTVADFHAATGHDARSVGADPRFADTTGTFELSSGSPAIDAASSAVADWPPLDARGRPRVDVAAVPDAGAGPVPYADLGIAEFVPNQPPVARLTVAPTAGFPPLAVTADASASTDADGTVVSYTFDFGDGTVIGPQSAPTAAHTYAAGSWVAIVTVRDDDGDADTAAVAVTAAPNLIANPSFESNTTGWNAYSGAVIARVPGGRDGAWALEMTGPATTGTYGLNDSPNWVRNVTAGRRYRYTAWVRSEAATGTAKIHIREYAGSPSVLQGDVWSPGVVLTPEWQLLTVDYVTRSNGGTLDLQVQNFPRVPGEVFRVDDVAARLVEWNSPPALDAPASVAAVEGQPLAVAVTAGDVDGDSIAALTADLSALPAGHGATFTVAADRRSGTLSWTPTFADSGVYDVTFTARNAATTTATTRIRVADVGRGPVLTAPATVNGLEAAPLSVTVEAADPDGDPIDALTADLSSLPAGHDAAFVAAADRRSGTLTWTPTHQDSGSWTVRFRAANGLADTAAVALRVANVDRAPVLVVPETLVAAEKGAFTLTVTADDPDGDAIASLTADLSGLPASSSASFTAAADRRSGTLTWTPGHADSGTYTITFAAANALAATASRQVQVANVDRTPVVTAPEAVTTAEGATLTIEVAAADPDGDPIDALTADLSGLPAGHDATFAPAPDRRSGRLTWTPGFADSGVFTIGFTAANASSGHAATTVRVANVDRAPVVAGGAASGREGDTLVVHVSASDPDGDPITALTADLSLLPAGHRARFVAGPDHATGVLTFPTTSADSGTHQVVVTAANALSGTASVVLRVDDLERAPQVAAPATATAVEGQPVTVAVTAADPDGDAIVALAADLSGLPAGHGATWTPGADAASGTLAWTPSFDAAPGPWVVSFTATAANGLTGSAATSIDVTPVDRAPVVTAPAAVEAGEGVALVVDVAVADPDGDAIGALVAELDGLPDGHDAVFTAAPDRASGRLTWTPAPGIGPGPFTVVFSASNALGAEVATQVRVDQRPVVAAPVSIPVQETATLTLQVTVSDPDGDGVDSLTADLSGLPAGHGAVWAPNEGRTAGILTWTPGYEDAPGPYTVRFVAGNALTGEAATVVQVVNRDRPPALTAPSIKNTAENLATVIEVSAGDLDGDAVAALDADLSGLPAGHDAVWTPAADRRSGTLSWTPTFADSGAYEVAFTAANDLSSSFVTRIEVANTDRAPVVDAPAASSGVEDAELAVSVTAADPDGDPIEALEADLSGLPVGHGATFVAAADRRSGVLSWRPDFAAAPGPHLVTFTARNALGGSSATAITLANVDRAPQLAGPAEVDVAEEDTLTVTVTASDPDDDPILSLEADLSQLPPSKTPTFTPSADRRSGVLTWSPSHDDQGGPYTVTFTATNALGAVTVTQVRVGNVDRTPVVTAPAEVAVDENAALTLHVTASDPDGDAIAALTADLSALPAGHDATWARAPDGRSGTLTWTPTFDDGRPASYAVTFTAANAASGSASTAIAVRPVDRAPVVHAPAAASAVENAPFTLEVAVSDPDGDPIATLEAAGLPPGATFTPAADRRSGTLAWTPGFDAAPGPYAVTFTAANALSASASTSVSVADTDRAPVVTVPAAAVAVEGQPLSVEVAAADPDGDAIAALTADLSGLPAGHDAVFTAAADGRSGTLTWTPGFSDGGGPPFVVAFRAANALAGSAETRITIDRHPVVTAPSTARVDETESIVIEVHAADPDGDPLVGLSADLSQLPPGHDAVFTVSADGQSGTLTWTPTYDDAPGPYRVTFSASSGLVSVAETDIEVVARDRLPEVAASPTAAVGEGRTLSLAVTASDADGDAIGSLTADLSALPAGHDAVFVAGPDRRSGTLTWTPTRADGRAAPYVVTFTAANGGQGSASTAITVDRTPEISVAETVSGPENQAITVTVTASDPDGDAIASLTADLSGLPAGHGATFTAGPGNTSGTLTWTPSFAAAPGPYTVTFTAANALAEHAMTRIDVANVDRAPVVSGPSTARIAPGRTLTLEVAAADADGDAIASLAADLSALPAGHDAAFAAAADGRTGTLTWTPGASDPPGPYPVTFTARNALSGTLSTAVSVNTYPVVTAPATASVAETSLVTVVVEVSDPDGEAIGSLTADLSALPAGHDAVFVTDASRTRGTLTWRPTFDDAPGSYDVVFTASNTLTRTATTTIQVTPRDRAPVVTAPAAVTGTEEATLTVHVAALDPDGDPIGSLTADLTNLPGGTFTPAADRRSGTLTWTPAVEDPRGPYTVTFVAANALSGSAATRITVEQYPVINVAAAPTVPEDSTLTLIVAVHDPDGDPISTLLADLSGLPAGNNATFTTNAAKTSGTLTWRPGYFDAPGPYPVAFTAANGLSRTVTRSVAVSNVDRAPAVTAPAAVLVAEGARLTVEVAASDPDFEAIGALTADLSALPAGHDATFTPAADRRSGILSWTPTAADGRIAAYEVRFTAANARSASAVTAIRVDQPPEVSVPATVSGAENARVTVDVTAADPDGDGITTLVADLSALPAGHDASFVAAPDGRSGRLTWTPTFADSRATPYVVTFTAANSMSGSASASIAVANTDRAPVVTAPATARIAEGVRLSLEVTAADPDGEAIATLTPDFSALPAGHDATFTPSADRRSGTLAWTPTAADGRAAPYVVGVTAANAASGTATVAITVDQPPALSVPAGFTVDEGEPLTVHVAVTDPDGEPIESLTADLSGLPAGHGATFTTDAARTTGTLAWTPGFAVGPRTVTVSFTARNAATGTAATTITVRDVDRAPVVVAPGSASVGETSTLTLNVSASDPDGQPIGSLTADLSLLPAGHNAVFAPGTGNSTGVFTWTPTHRDAPGPYPITFVAANGRTGTATTPITVINLDRPPVLAAPSAVAAGENMPVTITVTATDPDQEPIASLTANLSGIPAGQNATFTTSAARDTGTFRWTPSGNLPPGPYILTFTAANGRSVSATTSISVDRAPVLSVPAAVNAGHGQSVTLEVTVVDPDNEAIQSLVADLSAIPASENATFTVSPDRRSGTLRWTPTYASGAGPFHVSFSATNALSATATSRIDVDQAPVVTATAAVSGPEARALSVAVGASDPDGDPIVSLTADLSGLPAGHGATFTTNADRTAGTLTWTPDHFAAPGPYTVTFRAANALARTVSSSVTVENVDRAPTMTAASSVVVGENSTLSLRVTAVDPDLEPITAWSADLAQLPAGHDATFVPEAGNGAAVLTWRPTYDHGRSAPYPVRFTAGNALSVSASTSIQVESRPVVTAPASLGIGEGSPVSVTVTAVDPDGQPITDMYANLSGLPPGHDASFVVAPDRSSGVFTWTPSYVDSRTAPYYVVFTAANNFSGAAVTAIRVTNTDRAPVVTVPATVGAVESMPLTLTVTAADPDGQALTTLDADLSRLPAGHNATFTPNASRTAGTLTWTPTPDDGGRSLPVTFTAANVLSGASTTTITVDRRPTIAVPATTAAVEGTPVTLQVTASDPDGHAITGLTADLSGLPAGHDAVFTPNALRTAGTLTWTPGFDAARAAPYTVTFTASNALSRSASASITVTNTDRAPVVAAPASAAGLEAEAFTLTITAADPDGQPLTALIADLSALPPGHGATFTANPSRTSGTLAWTPTHADSGTYTVTFTSSNALAGTAATAIRIANADRAPVVTAPATAAGPENAPLAVRITAADPDGDAVAQLTADLAALPGATFVPDSGNAAGTLHWTPDFAAARATPYNVTFTAFNGTSGTATTAITVTDVDRGPGLTAPASVTAAEGATLVVAVAAIDPDGDPVGPLTADLSGLPAGSDARFTAAADHRSGELRWTPGYDDAGGPYSVTFAIPGVTASTSIMVADTDRAPVISAPASVEAFEGLPLSLRVRVADPEGHPIHSLTADLSGLPSGHNATFTRSPADTAGTLAWTPTYDDAPRTYTVRLTAANALTTVATVAIQVSHTNRPPVAMLTATPTTGVAPIELTLNATGSHDPDGSVASFTFEFGDGGVQGPQTSPVASHVYAAGNWTARVIVTDNGGARDTASVFVHPYQNFAANGGFETSLTGWTAFQDSLIARSAPGRTGDWSMQMVQAAGSTTRFGADDNPNLVSTTAGIGSVYRFEAWVRSGSHRGLAQLQVREMTGGTVRATALSAGVTLADAWQKLSLDYTVQFAGTSLDLKILDTPIQAGETFFVDDVLVRLMNVKRPVVTAPASATVAENGTLRIDVTASDPDGEPLSFLGVDLSGLPAGSGASFTGNATHSAGTLTWTPTFDHARAAPYTVTFIAANAESGSAATAVTVTEVDRAPVVTAPATATTGEGAQIQVQVSAADPDGQPITALTAQLAGLPAGHDAVFTPAPGNASGTLRWTPTYDDSGGPYTVVFTAANALSGSAATGIRVLAVDRAPTLTVASRVEAVEHQTLRLPVTAVDADGQAVAALRADLSRLPAGHGATFTVEPGNASGVLEWRPVTATPHGPFVVTFTAENLKSATVSCTLTVDHLPVLAAPATVEGEETAPVSVAVTVSDVDGDAITALSADLSGLPPGHNAQFTVDAERTSGLFTWTPTFRDAGGPYPVRFTAVNDHSVTVTTQILVANVDAPPVVTAPTTVSATENQRVTVAIQAEEPDGQAIAALTADLSGLPGGHDAVFVADPGNASGTLTWTPSFETAPGPYHVTFSAANALTGSTKTTISVANVDRAPVLSVGAEATAAEGAPFTLSFTAVDPDGQPLSALTADLSGLPPGHNAVFTPGSGNGTGTLTWTPTYVDAVGPYPVTFTARNALTATRTVMVRVTNTDRAPVVSAPIVGGGREQAPVVVDVTASDPDGAAIFQLTADLSSLPAGHDAAFTPAADRRSGRLTWTPAAGDSVRGPFTVTFTATNAASGSASTLLMVGSQDFPPMVSAPASVSTTENAPITVQVQAGDPNGDPIASLTANLSGLPAGHNAVFTPNASRTGGTLTWTPAFTDARALPYSVTFTASNARSGSVTTEINVANVDRAPVVTAPATAGGPDGSPITIQVSVADPDGQAITSLVADLSSLPGDAHATFVPGSGNTSGVLTWTPTPASVRAQPYTVGFIASNALSGSATTAVTVVPRDRAPVITVPSAASVGEGQPLTLTLTVGDPDGQPITTLTANLSSLPAGHGAVFTPNATRTAATLTWTPTFTDARPAAYSVSFTAANALSGTATTAITVTNVDRAPVVTAPASVSVIEGAPVTLQVTAQDPDGTAIASLAADLAAFPSGNRPVFTPNAGRTAGTLTWTPTAAEVRAAPYAVTFTAANALSGSATSSIAVAPRNQAPSAVLAASPAAVTPGSEVVLSAAGSTDSDGTIVSYTFDFGDGTVLGPQASPVAPHVYAAGGWTATVVIADDLGGRDTATVEVNANLSNLVANPGFETNLTGWGSNGSVTRTRVTTAARTGAASMQLRGGSSATATFGTTSSPNPVTTVAGVGRRYRFGAWVRGSTAADTGSVRLEVREFSGSSTQRGVTTLSPPARLTTDWKYLTVDYVVTTAGTNLNLRAIDTPRKSNETWLLDDVTCALVPLGDQAPVVTAPSAASVVRGQPLSVTVTAADPDGQAIAALTADLSGLPAGHGATFAAAADRRSGTLTWTPTPDHIRAAPYTVTFTAANALVGTASLAITVTDSAATVNLVANPGFETDLSGWAAYSTPTLTRVEGGRTGGFCIRIAGNSTSSFGIDDVPNTVTSVPAAGTVYRFSAWIRSDNSTRAVKLRIYELQGTSQVGATFYSPEVTLAPTWKQVTVDYTTRAAGTALSLRITDYPSAASEVFFIDDVSIERLPAAALMAAADDDAGAALVARADHALSLPRAFAKPLALEGAGTWTAMIEGLEAPELEGRAPAVALRIGAATLAADPAAIRLGEDADGNGFEEIHAAFPIEALRALLDGAGEAVEATVEIAAGTPEARSLPLRLAVARPALAFGATFGPNPMRGEGTLHLTLTRPGAVLAEVYDASGRRVRTLLDQASVAPGRHALRLDGRGERGERLAAGVYFYRVQASEGRLGGRIVIVR